MRNLLIVFVTVVVSCLTVRYIVQDAPKQALMSTARSTYKQEIDSTPIDGIYEFVSRTTVTTWPEQATERLAAPEWYGLWIFHDGYFSQTRMENLRPGWTPKHFPTDAQEIGFDGSSGTYTMKGDMIELKHMVNFYPGRRGDTEELKYHFDNEILTLTWELIPGPEYGAAGERIIVLRKIK